MKCFYECKACGEEIECSVIINEEDDLPETCDHCGQVIPDKAHEEVQIQAMEQAFERPYND